MKAKTFLTLAMLIIFSGCARYEWVGTRPEGATFAEAREECGAIARQYVRETRPLGDMYESGPAGFPPDSPRDLENRETERCLSEKGFEKVRVE